MPWNFSQRARGSDHSDATELGILFVQCLPAQAQFVQGRGPERGEQHIGFGKQLMQSVLPFGFFQITLDLLHAFVQNFIEAWRVVRHGIALRRIDLGASGAHLYQAHQCGGPG